MRRRAGRAKRWVAMARKTERPNILVFFTDQQRWDTCGCYRTVPVAHDPHGNPVCMTPNLDRMADRGVRFDLAFTCQPVCGPARACIQTGRYATEVGVHTNHRMLPRGQDTLARALSRNGYEVGYLGKWHLASFGPKDGPDDFRTRPVPPDRRGGYTDFWLASDVLEFTSHSYDGHMFDSEGRRRDFPAGRYRVDAQTDWLLEYLDSRTRERPFFMFCSYIEPHHQNDHHHFEGPHGCRERFAHFDVPGDLVDTEGDWRDEYPDYLGCIHKLDESLGRVLARLEDLGLAENTLVIFTSDHGCHFRTRNGEYKRSCHDACIRIPCVIRGPGFDGGEVVRELVSLIDLAPTILHSAGVAPGAAMRGRDLRLLTGAAPSPWREEVFLQISESHCGRAIRTRRWKYSVRAPGKTGADPDSASYVEDCLYDLDHDPNERDNLVTDPSLVETRAGLAVRLKRCMAEAGERVPAILPAT